MRALRTLNREAKSPFIFVSERGAPFTVAGLAKLIERAGNAAKIGFKVHPHMLRHACGYALANRGYRYAHAAKLPRAPQHPIDRALHRARARPL